MDSNGNDTNKGTDVLKDVTQWKDLFFYQKTDMTDRMMCSYLKRLEKIFVTQGGIKKRMHSARTGYRKDQDKEFAQLKAENARLKAELAELKKRLEKR